MGSFRCDPGVANRVSVTPPTSVDVLGLSRQKYPLGQTRRALACVWMPEWRKSTAPRHRLARGPFPFEIRAFGA